MESNGWKINIDNSNTDDRNTNTDNARICGKSTFYGYFGNDKGKPDNVGEVTATFRGSGKARLMFGNCYHSGYVKVKLNGKLLSTAAASTLEKEITFDYKKQDVLKIQEFDVAIIKLNYLLLTCNGKFIYIFICVCVYTYAYTLIS